MLGFCHFAFSLAEGSLFEHHENPPKFHVVSKKQRVQPCRRMANSRIATVTFHNPEPDTFQTMNSARFAREDAKELGEISFTCPLYDSGSLQVPYGWSLLLARLSLFVITGCSISPGRNGHACLTVCVPTQACPTDGTP